MRGRERERESEREREREEREREREREEGMRIHGSCCRYNSTAIWIRVGVLKRYMQGST